MTHVVVTVLAYRTGATIEAAVRSVLDQDLDGRVDVVVREQGGDPSEQALLRRLAEEHPSLVVESGENLGFAGGHDRLLAMPVARSADVVVLLNADASLSPSFLRAALGAFDDPTVGAVQGKVLRRETSEPAEEERPVAGLRREGPEERGARATREAAGQATTELRREHAILDAAGIVVRRTRRAEARFQGEPDDGRADRPGDVFGVDGAVAVYRRVALDDAAVAGHLLAVELGSYHEDVELAWRLRWRGWTTRYVPDAVAWHQRSAQEDTGLRRRERLRRRASADAAVRRQAFVNARLLPVRVEPLRGLLRDLPHIVAREAGGWLSLLAASPSDVPACAWRLVRQLPAALRARRAILARRAPGADPYRWIG